MCCKQFYD